MDGKALLVAAHADDELLGAWSLIRDERLDTVFYPLPLQSDRTHEAMGLAKSRGYQMRVVDLDFRQPDERRRVYLPSPTDKHAEHQRALTWGLAAFPNAELWEYSIEKAAPYCMPLPEVDVETKEHLFAKHYPSQDKWIKDPKYLLFEGFAPLGTPSITVTFSQHGFHHWADAPEEVSYLRMIHRHLFEVELTLHNLDHHDRDQEFHLVQAWGMSQFDAILDRARRSGLSCEEMARQLAVAARVRYQVSTSVSVSEDGENTARVSL